MSYNDRYAEWDEAPEPKRSKFQNRHRHVGSGGHPEPRGDMAVPELTERDRHSTSHSLQRESTSHVLQRDNGLSDDAIWEQLGKVLPGLQVAPNAPVPSIPVPEPHQSTDYTLRVRGGDPNDSDPKRRPTDAQGLSRSILHVLARNPHGYVNVKSVGITAMAIALTAFRLANEEVRRRTSGSMLVITQTEYEAEIGGKTARGICTRIFGIPIRDAV